MKYLKLLLFSVVGFVLLFWGITLLFPAVTVISRATNVHTDSVSMLQAMQNNRIAPWQWLVPEAHGQLDVRMGDMPFYDAKLFNATAGDVPGADTLFIQIRHKEKPAVQGGIAFYQLSPDSTTVQLFYVFENPWYKPWEKMRMMMMDKAIGPGMDSALQRLKLLPVN